MESKTISPELEQTQKRIVESASLLFFRKGIRAVTMDDIAHSLKMSKRTLYEIFSDKEELLRACYESWDAKRNNRVRMLLDKTDNVVEIILSEILVSTEMMKHISVKFYNEFYRYPSLRDFAVKKSRERHASAVEFLERGVSQGLILSGIDINVFLQVVSAMGEFVAQSSTLCSMEPTTVFRSTFVAYLRGIASEDGRRIIDEFVSRHFTSPKK